eukprot:m.80601 g.80601  ORF g.80601 m.80601 type:complete len:373 (-) comp19392_c0_seq1:158-1276(-)
MAKKQSGKAAGKTVAGGTPIRKRAATEAGPAVDGAAAEGVDEMSDKATTTASATASSAAAGTKKKSKKEKTEKKSKKEKGEKRKAVTHDDDEGLDGGAVDDDQADASAAEPSSVSPKKRKVGKVGKSVVEENTPTGDVVLADGETVMAPRTESARLVSKMKGSRRADGKLPCREFVTTGECKFGDKCKFSHLLKGVKAPKGESGDRKKRRAACLAFAEGTCKRGAGCRYRHVSAAEDDPAVMARVEEDRQIALALQGGDKQEDKLKRIMALPEALRQKARAIFFAKQRTGGFAAPKHVADGAGVHGAPKGVCFAYLRGACLRGDSCIFKHGEDATDPAESKQKWRAYREAKKKDGPTLPPAPTQVATEVEAS